MRHIKYKIALFLSPISAFWIIFARKNYPLNADSLFQDKIIFADSLFNSLPPALALGGFPQQSPDQSPHLFTSKSTKSDHFEVAPVHLTPNNICRQLKRSPPPWGPSPSPCRGRRGRKTYAQWTPCSPVQKVLLSVQVALQKLQMRIP